MPINRSRNIRYAFERPYTINEDLQSYLSEIHNWAQLVDVNKVDWDCQPKDPNNHRAGFWATPILPDCVGQAYTNCAGCAKTRDEAREIAGRNLFTYYRITSSAPNVRWRFSTQGTTHYAIPVVYGPNRLWDDAAVLGEGFSHQQAREDSARKLLLGGYCWV